MTVHCGVLGDPIEHSLSPVLHRAGYAAVGLDWSYDAHRVASGGLGAFLGSLDGSWRGLSLTMPLKREAMALVDEASETAELAGGANTLLLGEGRVVGDNTDVPGAVAALRERYDGPLDRVAVWGGGATAASLLLAAARLGCRSFELFVRDPARVADTLAAAARFPEPLDVGVRTLGDPVDADLLVSTIPALPQESLVDSVERVQVVFEVVYDPWPTPLARWATGVPLVTGLDLLVHQAALQFALFTGSAAPLEVMRDAGRAALAERG
ncbi:MAG: shikimate dehydrogenase [Nocardioidaceae bacterium]